MRFELARPRIIGMPRRGEPRLFAPWLQAALRLRVELPEWQHADESWAHWAAALGPEGRPELPARSIDPGRRAAAPGEPAAGERRWVARVGEPEARAFVEAIVAGWTPEIHRHRELGLVSRLDEGREPFRRRCLALLRPLLQRKDVANALGPRERAGLAAAIETLRLGAPQVAVLHARVAVAWYATGEEPGAAGDDLMVTGGARGAR